jgi:hypothetical protein
MNYLKTTISIFIVAVISVLIGVGIVNATAPTGGLRILGLGILDSSSTPQLSIDPNNRILYASNGTTTALSWASGNVGIGTTTPIGPLDVWSGGVQRFYISASGAVITKGQTYYISDYVRWEGNSARTYIGIWDGATYPQMLTILANGNVGIGTTAPTKRLHVYTTDLSETPILIETDKATNYFGMKDTSGTSYLSTISGAMRFMPLNVEKMRITTAGNVGIGTTAPGSKLHVSDGNAVSSALTSAFGANDIIHSINNSTGGIRLIGASDTPTNRLSQTFVKSRGTLTSPTAVVSGDTIGDLLFGGYDGSQVNFSAGLFAYADGTPSAGNTPLRLSFVTGTNSGNRTERLTIKNDGNVGIGTTAPNNKLTVAYAPSTATLDYTASGASNGLMIQSNDSATTGYAGLSLRASGAGNWHGAAIVNIPTGTNADSNLAFYTNTGFTNLTERMRITKDGNVGIGTTTPTLKLDVYGLGNSIGLGNNERKKTLSSSISSPYDILTIASLGAGSGWKGTTNFDLSYNGGSQFTAMSIVANSDGTTGNVGIGTTAPTSKLNIYSSDANTVGMIINGVMGAGGNADLWQMYGNNGVKYAYFDKWASFITSGAIYTSNGYGVSTPKVAAYNSAGLNLTDDGGNGMFIQDGGNVGIGTTAPVSNLDIRDLNTGDNIYPMMITGIGTTLPLPGFQLRGARGTLASPTATQANDNIGTFAARGFNTDWNLGSNGVVALKAEENHTSTAQGAYLAIETTASGGTTRTEKVRVTGSGNVGIGTTTPGYKLEVVGTGSGTNGKVLRVTGPNVDDADIAEISLGYGTADLGSIGVQEKVGGGTKFMYFGTSAVDKAVVIDRNGNVGIGTTTPATKLDVNGVVTIRSGGSANHAICWKSDGITLGYCSSVVASDGACTCN